MRQTLVPVLTERFRKFGVLAAKIREIIRATLIPNLISGTPRQRTSSRVEWASRFNRQGRPVPVIRKLGQAALDNDNFRTSNLESPPVLRLTKTPEIVHCASHGALGHGQPDLSVSQYFLFGEITPPTVPVLNSSTPPTYHARNPGLAERGVDRLPAVARGHPGDESGPAPTEIPHQWKQRYERYKNRHYHE